MFRDIPLVFMEMTFVQYVSLGPITIWKAVPLCKVNEMIFTHIICQNALLKGMLVFCGILLVFMEMAFGQYASLGRITIWKAVPLFKGNVSVLMLVFMEMAFGQYASL